MLTTERHRPPTMPTKHRRIAVMLPPEHYDAIDQLSKTIRLSKSRIIADLVEPSVPLLVRARKMAQDAASLTAEASALLRRDIDRHERTMERAASSAFTALADAEAAISQAAKGSREGMRAARPPRRPPAARKSRRPR